jgi:hypothetical protein
MEVVRESERWRMGRRYLLWYGFESRLWFRKGQRETQDGKKSDNRRSL